MFDDFKGVNSQIVAPPPNNNNNTHTATECLPTLCLGILCHKQLMVCDKFFENVYHLAISSVSGSKHLFNNLGLV